MKSMVDWSQLQKLGIPKLTILPVALGLAIGFAFGLMLHTHAETSPKVKSEPATGSQIRVHSGSTGASHKLSDLDDAISKLRASASQLSLPSSMFEPWWRTMQHDPDASWMLKNFDIMSSDLDRSWNFPVGLGAYIPRLDTTEHYNQIEITAEVPGIDEKNLDVTITDNAVTIKGDKKSEVTEAKSDKASHSIVERSYGSFERTVSLPCRVESDKAQAILKNGVLRITVPKSHLAQSEGKKLSIRPE